jgi:polysaccharide export outer membrane protein
MEKGKGSPSLKTLAGSLTVILLCVAEGLAQNPSSALPVGNQGAPVASSTAQPQAAPAPLPQASATPQPQLEQRYPRYRIQNQDSLLLTFPLSTELNQTVIVQPDGYINLQSIGSLHVQGMTVPELVVALKNAYSGMLHDPIITVDLEDYQKPFFTVSGQVNKPGQYDLRSDLTVAEALAVAGGMLPTAKTQVLLYHRTSHDWFEVTNINMKEILQGKNVNEDATLRPGDMIFVPEKFIANVRKYVPYSASTGTFINQ